MAQFHELCDITESNHIIQWAFASLGYLVLDFLRRSKQINKQASLNTVTAGWRSGWVVGLAKDALATVQWSMHAGLSPKGLQIMQVPFCLLHAADLLIGHIISWLIKCVNEEVLGRV